MQQLGQVAAHLRVGGLAFGGDGVRRGEAGRLERLVPEGVHLVPVGPALQRGGIAVGEPEPVLHEGDRHRPGEAVDRVEEVLETGVEAVIFFGIPESKDAEGSRAYADDGVGGETQWPGSGCLGRFSRSLGYEPEWWGHTYALSPATLAATARYLGRI